MNKTFSGDKAVESALERLRCNSWRQAAKGEPLTTEPVREDALLVEAKLVALQDRIETLEKEREESKNWAALYASQERVKELEDFGRLPDPKLESLRVSVVRLNERFLKVEAVLAKIDSVERQVAYAEQRSSL